MIKRYELLLIKHILDQQPGMVSINVICLDDLPLVRSSIRQDFLKRSRNWREQIQELGDQASNRLEGWLEEPPWEEREDRRSSSIPSMDSDLLEDWDCDLENLRSNDHLESKEDFRFTSRSLKTHQNEEDPWI